MVLSRQASVYKNQGRFFDNRCSIVLGHISAITHIQYVIEILCYYTVIEGDCKRANALYNVSDILISLYTTVSP